MLHTLADPVPGDTRPRSPGSTALKAGKDGIGASDTDRARLQGASPSGAREPLDDSGRPAATKPDDSDTVEAET